MTGRRGRRRKQLLDDLKEKRIHWKLKEEALDRTLWRTRFGRGYGPVVRQTTEWNEITISPCSYFPVALPPVFGSWPPLTRLRNLTHFRHITLGSSPLDEGAARRRDVYLTTHNIHKRQTCMPPAGLDPTMPASVRSQTHALDRTATGIGLHVPIRS
jgi:hypothetical protein